MAPERTDSSPVRRRVGLTLVVGLIVAAGVGWTSSRSAPDGATGATSTGGGVVQEFEEGERQVVAQFAAQLLDGSEFDSRRLTGSVAVYNVWGSWCAPCRAEAPALRRVARELEGEVAFVGINVRDGTDAALAFERTNRVPYPSIRAEDGEEALLAFGSSIGVAAVPTTVVLDRQGRVAARVVGPTSYTTLKTLVETVVAEGSVSSSPAHRQSVVPQQSL